MKLPFALFTAMLALSSSLAAAHPHDVPQVPPAPPAPAAPPAPPAPPMSAPPAFAPVPPLPAIPAIPAPPPPPTLEISDDVLAACEGKADGARVSMTASNGAKVIGTCRKRGNVYAFMLKSYELHRSR